MKESTKFIFITSFGTKKRFSLELPKPADMNIVSPGLTIKSASSRLFEILSADMSAGIHWMTFVSDGPLSAGI